jgi:hypothetical protein
VVKVESFKCDNCGKIRSNDANRWWFFNKVAVAHENNKGRDGPVAPIFGFTVGPFEARTNGLSELHLCGEDCVQKKVSEFLGGKL